MQRDRLTHLVIAPLGSLAEPSPREANIPGEASARGPFFLRSLLGIMIALGIFSPLCAAGEIQFRDATRESGIDFRHYSPLSTERNMHLFMGSGLAWLDFDRDGWPDLFCCQGQGYGDSASPEDRRQPNRLYRNLGAGRFVDVTAESGLEDGTRYSMGVAVGDFDNDGWPDLFVTNVGPNQLFRNNGDGTFAEQRAGLDDDRFGAGCAWADIDGDGDLDLYAANYISLTPKYPVCKKELNGKTVYLSCHPRFLKGEHDLLYRNEGNGEFRDVTEAAGLLRGTPRQGLGVVAADLDRDGDIDFYVANDSVPNQLWINQGGGKFVDEALYSGTSMNGRGEREAGMGLAVGDINGDRRLDLLVTNYFFETNTLYRNEGDLLFLDVTDAFGLGAPSKLRLAFGISLLDADNDGWQDIVIANGHVHDREELLQTGERFAQRAQLYRNEAGKRFREISSKAGDHFGRRRVGRSTAVADYDQDGRADVAILNLNDALTLLKNESASAGNSLRLELIGTKSSRMPCGAIVEVHTGGGVLTRPLLGGSGYLSTDESRLSMGLAEEKTAERVTVFWPSGYREEWRKLTTGKLHRLREGSGRMLTP